MSLDVVRAEVEAMGKQHQQIAGQMKSELEEQLSAFTGGLKERRKIVQTGIEKLLKVKMQQTAAVNKARDRYEQDSLKIKGYLAQGHMVMGHEERKNKAKLEKTQIQLSGSSQEYEQAVKILEETTARWNREWKKACDVRMPLKPGRMIANTTVELPRSRRGAHRFHEEQPVGFCQHRLNCLRQRRCGKPHIGLGTLPGTNILYSPLKRSVSLLRIARLRKTLQPSFASLALARRFQIRPSSSTSAEGTPPTTRP